MSSAKMKKIILLFGSICLLCSVLSLSACGSSNQDNLYKLNFSELNMKVGESERLELSGNGVIILEGVEWSSSVESVATVENGRVQAVGAGEAAITASYNGAAYTCSVTVEEVQMTSKHRGNNQTASS